MHFLLLVIIIQMKKYQREVLEHDRDDKVQSRIGLKNKLYNIGGDFDLSLFTESNNQNQRFSIMFPQINEPTLEDVSPNQNGKNNSDSDLQHYYAQGVTERNTYQKSNSNSKVYLLEMRVDQMTQEVGKMQAEIKKYKNTNQILKNQLQKTQLQLTSKNQLIERQRKQLSALRLKQLSITECESRNTSLSTKSLSQDSTSSFCAEMLSPDQTVQLLNQLLKKVSKSSKMVKHLGSDPLIRQILPKLNKI